MNTALKYLNFLLHDNAEPCIPTKDDAREAIRLIEMFPIAAGALQTLLKWPGDKEGIGHARRCIMLLEESEMRKKQREEARRLVPSQPKPAPAVDSLDDLA